MERYSIHSKTEDFLRRKRLEGDQIESICLHCFATVARSEDVSYLESQERQHICLERYSAGQRHPSS